MQLWDAMKYSHRNLAYAIFLLLLSGTVACSGTRSGTRSGVSGNQITFDQLSMDIGGRSTYEVIQRVRPQWLRKRGTSSFNSTSEISVYLDTNSATRFGSPSSLKQIRATDVESVEYFGSSEAQARFGLDNIHGVIFVHMKRGG